MVDFTFPEMVPDPLMAFVMAYEAACIASLQQAFCGVPLGTPVPAAAAG
jgi:hypothetical protein